MPQPPHISALGIGDPVALDADLRAIYDKCVEKLGFVPNVYHAYSLRPAKLRNFIAMYNELMLGPSGLSKLEREMVAVVVSSANRCYYCLVAHGQAIRRLSGDPELGEMIALNYRVAPLDARRRAMLDFAWKLTTTPYLVEEADRAALRSVGLTAADIFDLADTVGFFNLSNRMASATDMMPNAEYHRLDRGLPAKEAGVARSE
ncbi:MAG: peroxidase-related enzyme [Aliidongia sp.]